MQKQAMHINIISTASEIKFHILNVFIVMMLVATDAHMEEQTSESIHIIFNPYQQLP
ncbi:hypothetical protein ACJX0J_006921, partial [Zea mays]